MPFFFLGEFPLAFVSGFLPFAFAPCLIGPSRIRPALHSPVNFSGLFFSLVLADPAASGEPGTYSESESESSSSTMARFPFFGRLLLSASCAFCCCCFLRCAAACLMARSLISRGTWSLGTGLASPSLSSAHPFADLRETGGAAVAAIGSATGVLAAVVLLRLAIAGACNCLNGKLARGVSLGAPLKKGAPDFVVTVACDKSQVDPSLKYPNPRSGRSAATGPSARVPAGLRSCARAKHGARGRGGTRRRQEQGRHRRALRNTGRSVI